MPRTEGSSTEAGRKRPLVRPFTGSAEGGASPELVLAHGQPLGFTPLAARSATAETTESRKVGPFSRGAGSAVGIKVSVVSVAGV